MSRQHCIRAAIGRRSVRAASSIGRAVTATGHRSEQWRRTAADFASVVSVSCLRQRCLRPSILRSQPEEKGVPHGSIIESPKLEAQTGTENLRHILVVDDDPMVCMAIEVYLQRNHFRVTIAEGGEVELRALEHDHFDLVIIDIFMPHMRGFESIRIFHERAHHSADRDVRLRFRKSEFTRSRFPPDGARARRGTLSAQAVHAARVARRHRGLPRGAPFRRHYLGRAPGLARRRPS